jgi:acyl-CoA reductase-like NAD-dependent aldehyde dehydrogenase
MLDHKALFIDGRWQTPSGQGVAEVINPATEEVAGRVPWVMNATSTTPWPLPVEPSGLVANAVQRARRLHPCAGRATASRADEMAAVITAELGMPVQWCRSVQVDGPIIGLEQYIELAGLMDEVREVGNSLVIREAVGVCAFINPWNYPLHQLIGKLAPALAAGCTVVVKPSQETPLHAFAGQMIEAIGLPAGVFNLVSGPGSKVGEALARHPDVDMVSFTGSTGAGVRVAQAAAPTVKRVCLELGGKSPLLIAEDADLAAAVRYGVQDVMINSGQTCTALTRMLLPASRYAEALESRWPRPEPDMGDPLDPRSFLGRCVRRGSVAPCSITSASGSPKARACSAVVIRRRLRARPLRSPTLFADVDNRMRIAQEEIFGPVLCLIPYAMKRRRSRSPTTRRSACPAASGPAAPNGPATGRQLRAANASSMARLQLSAPFGGYKQSGNGREWGEEG